MTIRWLASLCALIAISCATDNLGKRGGLSEAQVAALPPDVYEAYDVFAFKCSRCHSLSRPLSAAITNIEHWESYVARMRRHAGSGISEEDATKILVFLRYYAEQKARAKAEERGEPPPTTSSSTQSQGARQ